MPMPIKRRLIALALCTAVVSVAFAQQRIVAIPAAAKRAAISFQGTNEVVIDGKTAARLAPGVRIFDRNNYLAMYGALSGTWKVKYLLEPNSGLVLTVWILTDNEIAAPDPDPAK